MSRIGVVVPESRLRRTLSPLVVEASLRGYPTQTHIEGLDVAVGLNGFIPIHSKVRRVAVDNWFDAWQWPPIPNQIMCYMSDYHADQHGRFWNTRLPMATTRTVGFLHAPADDPVPYERDAAVFFTAKLDVPEPERDKKWFRSYYRGVFDLARTVAARQGLRFVVKTRAKHRDPWWMRFAGCEVRGDDYDSLLLLRRAKWCVHFGSAAALEAALMGCYAYWFPAPEGHLRATMGREYRARMFAWPGVSETGVAPTEREVNPAARQEYVAQYLGNCDGKAAARVLDIAESL